MPILWMGQLRFRRHNLPRNTESTGVSDGFETQASRPPGLLTRTEPSNGSGLPGFHLFSSLNLNFINYRVWRKSGINMFGSIMQGADYLNEKIRSVKSDFSTVRKTRAHVQKYRAKDSGLWNGGSTRNSGGL